MLAIIILQMMTFQLENFPDVYKLHRTVYFYKITDYEWLVRVDELGLWT